MEMKLTLSSPGCFQSCFSNTAMETLNQDEWGKRASEGTRRGGQELSRKALTDGRVLCSKLGRRGRGVRFHRESRLLLTVAPKSFEKDEKLGSAVCSENLNWGSKSSFASFLGRSRPPGRGRPSLLLKWNRTVS